MAKQVTKVIKLQIPAGAAPPAPPGGPALGPAGGNIGEFVNQFNTKTKAMAGRILPVAMKVYSDRTFEFIVKKPPASRLILKAAGLEKGSDRPHSTKVGQLSKLQVEEIAKEKREEPKGSDIKSAKKNNAGTARLIGVDVG